MLAIVKTDQRLTEADAKFLKKEVKDPILEAGFGDISAVMVLGKGTEIILIDKQERVIFSTMECQQGD